MWVINNDSHFINKKQKMESIKTFKDLEFEMHPIFSYIKKQNIELISSDTKRAIMEFENGYGVSVVSGDLFYSNGIDTYEVGILKDGILCCDTYITDDVLGYQNEEEVTEIMRKVQELNK
jgi:hypothetical protein